MPECAYCGEDLRLVSSNIWVDAADDADCSGDSENTNENGLHTVFDPTHGFDEVCLKFVPDSLGEDPAVCIRCFHHESEHEED